MLLESGKIHFAFTKEKKRKEKKRKDVTAK